MTVYSSLRRSKHEIEQAERALRRSGLRPAIDFFGANAPAKNKDHKHLYRVFEVPLHGQQDPEQQANDAKTPKYTHAITKFDAGTPEEWCVMRTEVEELADKLGFDQPKDDEDEATFADRRALACISYYNAVLDGVVRGKFNAAIKDQEDRDKNIKPAKKLMVALNVVAASLFTQPNDAYRNQKRYLLTGELKMGRLEPRVFANRLIVVNNWLQYFPRALLNNGQYKKNAKLTKEELLDVIELARGPDLVGIMARPDQPKAAEYSTVDEYVELCNGWWDALQTTGAGQPRPHQADHHHEDSNANPRKRSRDRRHGRGNDDRKTPGITRNCRFCKGNHRASEDDCWDNPKNKGKKPKSNNMISKDRAAKLFTYFMRNMEEQEKTGKDKKKGTIN